MWQNRSIFSWGMITQHIYFYIFINWCHHLMYLFQILFSFQSWKVTIPDTYVHIIKTPDKIHHMIQCLKHRNAFYVSHSNKLIFFYITAIIWLLDRFEKHMFSKSHIIKLNLFLAHNRPINQCQLILSHTSSICIVKRTPTPRNVHCKSGNYQPRATDTDPSLGLDMCS